MPKSTQNISKEDEKQREPIDVYIRNVTKMKSAKNGHKELRNSMKSQDQKLMSKEEFSSLLEKNKAIVNNSNKVKFAIKASQ